MVCVLSSLSYSCVSVGFEVFLQPKKTLYREESSALVSESVKTGVVILEINVVTGLVA